MSSWLVVGVSGVTNGGKSTLTQQLQSCLPTHTRVISQDDYFYPEDSQYHVPCPGGISHHNWEVITALDMKKMMYDVSEIVKTHPDRSDRSCEANSATPQSDVMELSPVLLMDGFILYDHPGILEVCDLRYFLTLKQEECWERRSLRAYDPPDPPGYFEACVWPMYEQHLARVKEDVPDVIYLDGMKDNLPLVLQQVTAAASLKKKKYTGAILG